MSDAEYYKKLYEQAFKEERLDEAASIEDAFESMEEKASEELGRATGKILDKYQKQMESKFKSLIGKEVTWRRRPATITGFWIGFEYDDFGASIVVEGQDGRKYRVSVWDLNQEGNNL